MYHFFWVKILCFWKSCGSCQSLKSIEQSAVNNSLKTLTLYMFKRSRQLLWRLICWLALWSLEFDYLVVDILDFCNQWTEITPNRSKPIMPAWSMLIRCLPDSEKSSSQLQIILNLLITGSVFFLCERKCENMNYTYLTDYTIRSVSAQKASLFS